jgi:hypothetical protein
MSKRRKRSLKAVVDEEAGTISKQEQKLVQRLLVKVQLRVITLPIARITHLLVN